MALDAPGHRTHDYIRGHVLKAGEVVPSRLLYLDWLRGLAVLAMVHAHTLDSWTRDGDRTSQAYYSLQWIGGVASPLFLFLAGAAMAMSAASKTRKSSSIAAGARAARRRGWEIFVLAFAFRLQAEILGWGPLSSLLKVDMLNVMGVSIVIASLVWQTQADSRLRAIVFAALTAGITCVTPLVRATPLFEPLPDPIEAYIRPAGNYSAFPLFPWAGFLFAGVAVGDLIERARAKGRRALPLQIGFGVAGILMVALATTASYQPPLYRTASFWHDSPTIFFIRLGAVCTLVATAWSVEGLSERGVLPLSPFQALVLLGRSSLFVYWIHVEMVYGVIAEPIKRGLPLSVTQLTWLTLCYVLYRIVLWKNRVLEGYELPSRARIFATVLR